MIDSTLMLTILPCERVASYDIIFYFSYIFHLYLYFSLIKQLFKTSRLTAKQGKAQLSYILIHFKLLSLERQNHFVLTSLKAATQIFPENMYFILKCTYESTQKIFQCCPFRHILRFGE